jgi:hypothetical protein
MAKKGPYKQTPVDSECMSVVGYNAQQQQLDITFRKSKAVYRYYGVDNRMYDRLMGADSRGRFFVNNIRMAYHYQRIA